MILQDARSIKAAGLAGMFGAALWLVALFVEYAYDLFPPGQGTLFAANQAMFFVAQLCYLTAILGLIGAGAAGGGLLGRASLGLFALGWTALAGALGLSLISDTPLADALIPVGGIASTLGGLLGGIAVAISGRLRGGWRLAPLAQGLYYALVLFLPLFFGQEPTLLTESLWTGTWFLLGLALFVGVGAAADRRSQAARSALRPSSIGQKR